MKELFLPYELAVIAKEKGYKELCFALVTEKNVIQFLDTSDFEELDFDNRVTSINDTPCVPAPLYQQIVDWFREKHKIHIHCDYQIDEMGGLNTWRFMVNSIWGEYPSVKPIAVNKSNYSTYYEALKKAIEEAFKLIS